MLLREYASIFVKRPSSEDSYGASFERYDLKGVMAFEKQAADGDGRDRGSLVLYLFPRRSRVIGTATAALPSIRPGDYCAVGKWSDRLDPLRDDGDVCRRITAVTVRSRGEENIKYIVIEAE